MLLLAACVGASAPRPPPAPPPRAAAPAAATFEDSAAWPAREGACRCWRGLVFGNDPGVTTHLYLCREGARLTGSLRWESRRSGTSVREVSGSLRGSSLSLRDERIVAEDPRPGWRFCKVESYSLLLEAGSGKLSGSYESAECTDRARVLLAPTGRTRCLLSALRR